MTSRLAIVCFSAFLTVSTSTIDAALIEVYSAGFQSGGVPLAFVGGGTSTAGIGPTAITAGLSKYLGRFNQGESTILTLNGLASHTKVRLKYDLYLFNTWDGSGTNGLDYHSLSGDLSFSETFTNHQGTVGSPTQTYATLGDVFLLSDGSGLSSFGDALSTQAFFGLGPSGTNSFFEGAHTASTFTVTFGGPTTQSDEQWGIDNVQVFLETDNVVVPEPTTFAIWSLLGGIGLVVGHRRRRRKAA